MLTFSSLNPYRVLTRLRQRLARGPAHDAGLRSQAGFTLIEVVISSLIVGIITIATFTGFDVLGRYDADQRHHNEATVLAAQADEALRSDPASTLDELVSATLAGGGHTYTQTVQGMKYTITQTAEFEKGTNTAATCSASAGHANEASNFIRVLSSVKWSGLAKNRPPVTQATIITPPVGSALEVDVTNGSKTEAPVPGVTVISEGSETTTNENGCVIYNGIPSTTTEVEAFKTGYVTKSGAHVLVEKEVSIVPNIITHLGIILAQGASITADFKYKNSTTWTHLNNSKANTTEPVKGDTFVAFNNEIGVSPELMAGSTAFSYNASGFYATVPGTYEAAATTPIESAHYPTGDLFPQRTGWEVYAGDCSLNNPEKYGVTLTATAALTAGSKLVTSVPMSYVTLNVYKGTKTTEGFTTVYPLPVKITNESCANPTAPTPNDAYQATYTHTNSTTSEAHLTNPFQPFGKFKLCVWSSAEKKTYSSTYTNSTVEGSTVNIFLPDAAGTYTEGSGTSLVETTVLNNQTTNTC